MNKTLTRRIFLTSAVRGLQCCLAVCAVVFCGTGQAVAKSIDLAPAFSGGDGTHTQMSVADRAVWQNSGESTYLYFRRPDDFEFKAGQTLYVRVTYLDDDEGLISIEYDAKTGAYISAPIHTRSSCVGTGEFVSAYFELPDVHFGKRQNGHTDFRLRCGSPNDAKVRVSRITLSDTPFDNADFQFAISRPWKKRHMGPAKNDVDAGTTQGKVMAGYQGWFRTPNDLDDRGWDHWVRSQTSMTPPNFTVDAWPDLTEYDPASLYRAGNLTTRSGAPAHLFSSTSYSTVRKHFEWMRKHNIDGAWLQRFHPQAGKKPEWVLRNVSQAAAEEGRVWGITYDVSGMSDATVVAELRKDWEWLVTQFDILNDPRYVRENGKPVVFLWGLPIPDRMFTPANANAAVDYFKSQSAYVIGGIGNQWKSLDADWQAHIAKYDGILVWQNQVTSDAAFFRERGQDFFPHIWPGFSWAHLKQYPSNDRGQYVNERDGGQFYWNLGHKWINGGAADRLYVGMFDEYDEGTHIMPMSDDPPAPHTEYGRFLTNEGKPGDWWMMLTGELKRMMRGEREKTNILPGVESLTNRPANPKP